MISKWKLFNFKSIKNQTELQFGPLTIFAGANSSGKSTWIQSILLISQTLAHRIDSRSVVLNGALTRLGQFDDLKSYGGEAEQIVIGFECSISPEESHTARVFRSRVALSDIWSRLLDSRSVTAVSCEISFDTDPSSPQRDLYQLQPRLFGCQLSAAVRAGSDSAVQDGTVQMTISRASGLSDSRAKLDGLSEEQRSGVLAQAALSFDVSMDPESASELGKYFSAVAVGCSLRHFLPSQLVVRARMKQGDLFWNLSNQISLWREGTPGSDKPEEGPAEKDSAPEETLTAIQLPGLLGSGVSYLDRYFTRCVKYLGPLRDEPKPLYPLAAGADPTDVGLRGEYTAAVLDLHKNERVRYIPTERFVSPEIDESTILRSLDAAVTDWLKYLGVAETVVTVDKGKLGHELKIIPPGLKQPTDLTHVGVGVSQVLPILVMCLLAEQDTTLIFEQPELHLHPRVQTLLGDFFLSLASLGKQCILETHSEYLINRLRFRAAASKSADIAKKIKMYFVEKPADASTFRSVKVNEFGAIEDWPEGFFDQSQKEAEATLRAAMQKKRQSHSRKE